MTADRAKLAEAFGLPALPPGPVLAVIWTTTPWTIPANQALNVHPEFRYALVATPRGHLVLAEDLVAACLARYKLEGRIVGTATGRGARADPVPRTRSTIARRRSYLGDYVTLEQGTGVVHSAPAYGIEDFASCRRYGMKDDEIETPVQGNGAIRRIAAVLRRHAHLGREPEDRGEARRGRRAPAQREIRPQLHALLAAQDADHLSRHDAMVRRHGRRDRLSRR